LDEAQSIVSRTSYAKSWNSVTHELNSEEAVMEEEEQKQVLRSIKDLDNEEETLFGLELERTAQQYVVSTFIQNSNFIQKILCC
jgi:hypothetical protein